MILQIILVIEKSTRRPSADNANCGQVDKQNALLFARSSKVQFIRFQE